jgi:capsular polysaccharide biosynthesis protein
MNTAATQYCKLLLARWRWVVWGILLALLVTTVVLLVAPPVYRSEATVFVRTPGDISRVQDGGDLFARARAGTYAALANSTSLSTRVIADLGLDMTPEALSRRIVANPRVGTALLDLAVSAPSEAEAERTATVLLSELESTVRDLESVPGSLVPRAELVVVDHPRGAIRVVAFGAPVPLVLLGAGLLGALLGALAAVIRSTFSDSAVNADLQLVPVGAPGAGIGHPRGKHRRGREVSASAEGPE